jgi:hypothetical protein
MWFITEDYFKVLEARECFQLWIPFIDDMLIDCSRVNLKNLIQMLCVVALRLIYLLILKDREVLEASIKESWEDLRYDSLKTDLI